MSALLQKQQLFAQLLGKLLTWVYANGFAVTVGDAYRTPDQAAANAAAGTGIAHSLHSDRLAIDLNLFIHGEYQATSEAYKPLGDYWKSLHEGCCWGGDFTTRADGNHFSITDGGRA